MDPIVKSYPKTQFIVDVPVIIVMGPDGDPMEPFNKIETQPTPKRQNKCTII
jgi:hypothetical protein